MRTTLLKLIDDYKEQKDKIERLNNIINELEKYIEENSFYEIVFHTRIIDANKLLDKLKGLKGSDKE